MRIILIMALALITNIGIAQYPENYSDIKLATAEDCRAAEPTALKASTYLLSTPNIASNMDRLYSLSFLLKWMAETPDFRFTISEDATKLMKGNDDLLGLYLAGMTKYCLENKPSSKDEGLVKLNAFKLVLDYCADPNNNVKMTKPLKKLAEAKAKGELEKALH